MDKYSYVIKHYLKLFTQEISKTFSNPSPGPWRYIYVPLELGVFWKNILRSLSNEVFSVRQGSFWTLSGLLNY